MQKANKYYYKNLNILLLVLAINLFLFEGHIAKSQEVVISEYYNGASPSDDWTELLVTQDNISLENYFFKDYHDTGVNPIEYSIGLQFQYHSLWQNLRAGTIIVIHHRGNTLVDVNKEDGYIELGAENTEYFTKVDMQGNWDVEALDIREDAGIVRIFNNYGQHVHSLSHMTSPISNYLYIPNPKLNFPGICPVSESISVTPGRNIGNYDGNFSTEWCTVSDKGNYVTMGKPNKRPNFLDDNLKFWQELRTPVWDSPNLTTNVKPDNVDLSWSLASDPNSADLCQGYLILRILEKEINQAQNPSNGTSYLKGDKLGTALVVDNVSKSSVSTYTDSINLDCNESYIYRVIAYRYKQDDILGNGIPPSNGRGRTYNLEDMAETQSRKTRPAKPTISTENDETQFCAGDSLLILSSVFGGPYSYLWYFNSQPISNSNKKNYFAKSAGWYKVQITNEKGCSSVSDSIRLSEMPSPTVLLFFEGRQLTKDTVLTLCENENHLLKVSGGDRYEWFKDNVKMGFTGTEIQISQEGLYFAVAINNGMICTDTSVRVMLDVTHVAYNFDKDTLFYNLDKYTRYEDKAVRITNSSTDSLIFTDIMIPPGGVFSMFVPPPAEIILPNRSKDYTIRFEPNKSGDFLDSITFILPCKNAVKRVYLIAHKERMNVGANPYNAVFDTLLACEDDSAELIIRITNYESFSINVNQPTTEIPFYVVSSGFPKTITSNSSLDIVVKFKTGIPGVFNKNLIVPFSANGVNDELWINLSGKGLNTSYRIEYYGQPLSEIEFSPLTGCDDSAFSAIQIFNTGEVDLEFSVVKDIPGVYLNDLPLVIKPNNSKEIPLLFVPQQEGNFSRMLYLTTEPCSNIDSVRLKGSKYGITYGMDKQKVSFDKILNCITPEIIYDSLNLIVSGQSQETPYIADIRGPKNNYFSHDIVEGMTLSDTNTYHINLVETALGEYYDTLNILIKPCDIEKIIPIYAKRINPELFFSTDSLDFGSISIETKDTNYILIKNIGEVELVISDIRTLSAPFDMITNFPVTLEPDSSIDIFFEYSPMQIKADNLKLDILLSEPCDLSYDLWLLGRGDVPKYIAAEISVPEYISGELAKDVNIPVSINAVGNRTIDEAKISEIDLSLRYNPTLLYPKSVSTGNSFSNSQNIILNYNENPPGLLNISCKIDTSNKVINGKMFNLKFLALLGNEISTPLIFEIVEFKSVVEVIPDTNGGLFKLTGDCSLEDRLLNFGGNFDLYLASENPITDIAELAVELPMEANTSLDIFDVNGNSILRLMQGNYPPGKYFINFNAESFSAGVYVAILKQSTFSKSLKLIVEK